MAETERFSILKVGAKSSVIGAGNDIGNLDKDVATKIFSNDGLNFLGVPPSTNTKLSPKDGDLVVFGDNVETSWNLLPDGKGGLR